MTSQQMNICFWTAYQNYEAADDDVAEEATVRSPVAGCLPGFHQNPENLKCYRVFSDQRVSWRVARDRCKSSGAELVSIQSSRDQSFISELLRKKSMCRPRFCICMDGCKASPHAQYKLFRDACTLCTLIHYACTLCMMHMHLCKLLYVIYIGPMCRLNNSVCILYSIGAG